MRTFLLLPFLGLCSAQFVFFGNSSPQQSPQQNSRFSAAARPAVRQGRILVEDVPSVTSAPDESAFANTFFRPSRPILKPNKKNPLPVEEEKEDVLVEILTEVPRTKIAEGSQSEALVIVNREKEADDAVLPPALEANDLREIPETTSPAPVTTETPPVTTQAPVITERPAPRVAPIATRVLGTPRIVQIGSRRPSTSSVSRPAPTPAPRAPVPAPRAPATPRTPKAISSITPPKGNYEWQNKRFLLTWRTGRNNFDWNSGKRYCESQGMRLISLDTKEKTENFLRLVGTDRAPYFWSGGQVSRDSRTLTWLNGVQEPISRGQHPWSFTGRTGPQPDGGETCLAILNSVYRDGVKYHDVACHHRKPVVCEEE